MAISRASELPATAVDNGDGSWSDSAYPDRTGERETIGALTWENQGRLRILTPTDARDGETPLYRFTELDENLLPLAESLNRTSSEWEPAFPYDDCDEVQWYASAAMRGHHAPWSETRAFASMYTWACHQAHTVARWRAADYPPSPSTIE